MLNCISETMRPKSGMKRPSTPLSFICRSTISLELRDISNIDEQAVGVRIVAQVGVDAPQRARHQMRRVGMDREAVLLGQAIEPDEIDGIASRTHPPARS